MQSTQEYLLNPLQAMWMQAGMLIEWLHAQLQVLHSDGSLCFIPKACWSLPVAEDHPGIPHFAFVCFCLCDGMDIKVTSLYEFLHCSIIMVTGLSASSVEISTHGSSINSHHPPAPGIHRTHLAHLAHGVLKYPHCSRPMYSLYYRI